MDAAFACFLDNPALLRAALAFNACRDAPSSASAPGFPAAPRRPRLLARPSGEAPAAAGVWCFEPEPHRLALLPPAALERLFSYWSAAVLAEALAKTIEGGAVREVIRVIGAETYRYAVRRGRFQLGGLRARLRFATPPPSGAWTESMLRQPGLAARDMCLALWPEALRAAWRDHWREELPDEASSSSSAPDVASFAPIWVWLRKILLTEVAPEWQPCFNS
jgi:hypothetical protein